MMSAKTQADFIHFLKSELSISDDCLAVAMRHQQRNQTSLYMSLYRFGLIAVDDLARILDWLEEAQLSI